jgi:hypothetical protein
VCLCVCVFVRQVFCVCDGDGLDGLDGDDGDGGDNGDDCGDDGDDEVLGPENRATMKQYAVLIVRLCSRSIGGL